MKKIMYSHSMKTKERRPTMKQLNEIQQGLYRESFEHDNCGIGAIVNIKGRRSHGTVAGALEIVEHLEHRAGKDAEGKTGDGVGILLQISHRFFRKVCKPLSIEIGGERDYGVGMFFFPQDELKRNQAKNIFEVIVKKRRTQFPRMERSAGSSRGSGEDGVRLYAVYYAGIYRAAGPGGEGAPL